MDQFTHTLVPFPLLASHSDYFPDTQDLTVDTEARDYWLDCFEDGLDKVSFAILLGLLKYRRIHWLIISWFQMKVAKAQALTLLVHLSGG